MVAARVMTEAEEATGAAEATFGSLATPAARDDGSGRGASRRPSRFLDALPAHYDPTTDPLPEGSFRAPAQGTIVRPRIPSAEPELVIDGSGMGTADAGKPQTTGNSRGRSRCPSKEALGAAAPAMAAEVEDAAALKAKACK